MPRELTVGELRERVGGEIEGDASTPVTGVAPLEGATGQDLSFLATRKYLSYLSGTQAAAVIVSRDVGDLGEVPETTVLLWVEDAHIALAEALEFLYPPRARKTGVAPTAILEGGVEFGSGVWIGPYAVVGEGSQLGDDVSVGAHTVVGAGCRIGHGTELREHVTLYAGTVVGARCIIHSGVRLGVDGFGYVFDEGGHRKVPQVGRCVVEDDVEIGANTTIDRGSVGDTRIGAGTKIDNLVQIGHNVRIGRNCVLAGQVGIAGSSRLGDGVALAGQVGISGHVSLGDGVRVAAKSGVGGDIPAGETYFGSPARPHTQVMRAYAVFLRLPELFRRLRHLEQRVGTEPDS